MSEFVESNVVAKVGNLIIESFFGSLYIGSA